MSYKEYNLIEKEYIGYVLKYQDPLKLGRYAVYIPELFKTALPGTKYIWCKNKIGNFAKYRDPFTKQLHSFGNYFPLKPGVRVRVKFLSNDIESGIITGIDSDVSLPFPDRDNYYLIYQTDNNSKMYVNEVNNIFHLQHANGLSNIFVSEKEIILQKEKITEEGYQRKTSLILDDHSFTVSIGKIKMILNESGFTIFMGDDTATYFSIDKNGINAHAKKIINMSSEEGSIHLYSKKAFVNGYDETHVLSNDLRLTGSQKAQLSGTSINIQGWMDVHVKAMHIGIESIISTDMRSTVTNVYNIAYYNNFSNIINQTCSTMSISASTYARAASLNATDGMHIRGMGAGANVSGSVGSSVSSASLSLYTSLFATNTALLINDPLGVMAAANAVLTSTIAGSARSALGFVTDYSATSEQSCEDKDALSGLIEFNITTESDTSKYILPDEIVKL